MARQQLEIFATPSDVRLILEAVEESRFIKYAAAGSSDSGVVQVLNSASDVLTSIAAAGSVSTAFLAIDAVEQILSREVPQAKGDVRSIVDQIGNPASVVVRPGVLVDEATLLAGQVGTASDDPRSGQLFASFRKAVKGTYLKVKSYWVGPEALKILDSGGRLTANVRSPREYDLRR